MGEVRPSTDDEESLAYATDCPVSPLVGDSSASLVQLLERWRQIAPIPADQPTCSIALLAAEAGSEKARGHLVGRLAAAGRGHGIRVAGPGRDGADVDIFAPGWVPNGGLAPEQAALNADLIVLVARKGARLRDVRARVNLLRQFGNPPRWAVLVDRRGARSPAPAPAGIGLRPVDTPSAPDRQEQPR